MTRAAEGSRKVPVRESWATEVTSEQLAPSHPRGTCNLRPHCPCGRGWYTRYEGADLGRWPRRTRRAQRRRCTQEKSGGKRVIYIAGERTIETRNHIQERRRARRRREKTRDTTRGDTGNDGGGRERVQAPDARPARSSVGNSRPLLSRTSTSFPAHRRRPPHWRAWGRVD